MGAMLRFPHYHKESLKMKPKLEILPQKQLTIYPHLIQAKELGFTLFGGTAIALQLGHRESVDFDFFTDKKIDNKTLLGLKGIKADKILQNEENTLVFLTDSKVKMSFFGGIDFVKQVEKISTNDNILELANLDSLLATKLKATCDRAEYKDYFDIATILRENKTSLYKGLELMQKFFGKEIPPLQILKGLTFFDDGDLNRLQKTDKKLLIDEVQKATKFLQQKEELQNKLDRNLRNYEKVSDEKQKQAFLDKANNLVKEAKSYGINLDSKSIQKLERANKEKDRGMER